MEERAIPPADEPSPKIVEAEALFDHFAVEEATLRRPETPPVETGGSYDVQEFAESEGAPRNPLSVGPSPPPASPEVRPGMRMEPSESVEHVWTRWGEWGGTITVLAVAALCLLGFIYLLLSWEIYGLAFLFFLTGGIFLAYLAYPIMITLERPVRITPEQAVQDYLAALSHHFPHYRRMWLLLSNRGKVSGSFASFEGFCEYWNKILKELRSGKTSGLTPLRFTIEDFKSPKSVGLSSLEATYTVSVLVRGHQDAGPIHSIKVKATLVKGPDRMWYLDHGTLP